MSPRMLRYHGAQNFGTEHVDPKKSLEAFPTFENRIHPSPKCSLHGTSALSCFLVHMWPSSFRYEGTLNFATGYTVSKKSAEALPTSENRVHFSSKCSLHVTSVLSSVYVV